MKNNIKYLALLLAISLVGFHAHALAVALFSDVGFLAFAVSYVFRYALAIAAIVFFVKKCSGKCNKFVLPISFAAFAPLLWVYFHPVGYLLVFGWIACPLSWGPILFGDIFYFSLLLAAISLVVVLVKSKKHTSA